MDNSGEEEVGEYPTVAFDLSESETEFRDFVKNLDALIERINRISQWQFIDVALSFMEKGFTDSGLEQLLWHITAVEALMGERGSGLTNRLYESAFPTSLETLRRTLQRSKKYFKNSTSCVQNSFMETKKY